MTKKIVWFTTIILILSSCKFKPDAWDIHSTTIFHPSIGIESIVYFVPFDDDGNELTEESIQLHSIDAKAIITIINQDFTEDDGCFCQGDAAIYIGEYRFKLHFKHPQTTFYACDYNGQSGTLKLTSEETTIMTEIIEKNKLPISRKGV